MKFTMLRTAAVLTATTTLMGLAACGHDAPKATGTQSTVPAVATSNSASAGSSTATSASTPTSSASQTSVGSTSSTSAASSSTSSAGTTSGGSGETKVLTVWPDASWQIQETETDPCAMTPSDTLSHSGYSTSPDSFTCGAMAAGLLACKYEASGKALCLQSLTGKLAARFPTPKKKIAAASGGPEPLRVTLTDGTTCDTVSHDQTRHYDERSSWLYCGDTGVLLLPKNYDAYGSGKANPYFDKSKPLWTAQLSVNNAKPTTVGVASVTYSA